MKYVSALFLILIFGIFGQIQAQNDWYGDYDDDDDENPYEGDNSKEPEDNSADDFNADMPEIPKIDNIDTNDRTKNKWFELIDLKFATTGIFHVSTGYPSDDSAASGSLDMFLTAPVAQKGKLYSWLELGKSSGLSVPSLLGWNSDAYDETSLTIHEMWYEHTFKDKIFAGMMGMIDFTYYFDKNAVANDIWHQFISPGFKNSIAVEWPAAQSLGFIFLFTPTELVTLSVGLADSDGDWHDPLDDLFLIFEFAISPKINETLQGNYRAFFWYDDKDHVTTGSSPENDAKGWGFAVSCDQVITDGVALFLRFNTQASDIYFVTTSLSFGMHILGTYWEQPEDALGFAIGLAFLNADLKESSDSYADEFHLEVYYRYVVNSWLEISPNVQFSANPGGYNTDSVFVMGVRFHIFYN